MILFVFLTLFHHFRTFSPLLSISSEIEHHHLEILGRSIQFLTIRYDVSIFPINYLYQVEEVVFHYKMLFVSEKAMATHCSTLVWKIPWREEPGGLQSMGLRRVGHDWGTSLSLFTYNVHMLNFVKYLSSSMQILINFETNRMNYNNCFLNAELILHSWNKFHIVKVYYLFNTLLKCTS